MSATAAPVETTVRVYGKRTDEGAALVCVMDRAAGLEMCWHPLDTVHIAATMAQSAYEVLIRERHEMAREQSDDVVVPKHPLIYVPKMGG